jgi:PhnB protein
MAKAAKPVPSGYHTITPQLTLDNGAQTIEWYKKAFGAEEIGRHVGPDGKISHAELRIGDSRFMVNDAMMGGKGPQAYGGSPASLWLYVEDCDTLFNRAVSAGGAVDVPMGDQFWGDRGGVVRDPAGYTWWIATRKEDLTPKELEERAAEFFKRMSEAPEPARR